jgi:very-short-patch-repair endonuclease
MKKHTIGNLARKLARELRNNPTRAEKILWNVLKNRQLSNLKFLRQHPVFYQYNNQKSFFIADFYCHELRMVIELDGPIHMKRKDYDQIRTEILDFKNIVIVRFKNEEITNDLDTVLKELKVLILKRKNRLEKI